MLITLHLPALIHLTVSVLVLGHFWVVGDVGVVVLPRGMLLVNRLTLLHNMPDDARFPVTVFPHHAYLRVVALRSNLLNLIK